MDTTMENSKIKKDWTPAKIRQALYIAQGGLGAQAIIARDLGITKTTVGKTIDGFASDRVRKAIATYIGTDLEEIWPSIYIYGNKRRPGRPRASSRSAAA
jgi:lambda repressor-like predicted transcriptional regulator